MLNERASGICVDLQNVLTRYLDILLKKLNRSVIRGVANNWFSPYLQNRLQYISISGFNSDFEHLHCSVLQGSIPGPLLFLIYINALQSGTRYSSVDHFSDDENILNYSSLTN